MDHAVSLVQAYLQLNGYFTSAEYPIIASAGRSGVRTITDIDVLAFRFPIIRLGHVLEYLHGYVRKHWHVLRHLQFKDPAFGFLMTLEKARRGGAGRRGEGGVELVESSEPRRPHSAPRHLRRPRYGRH